MSENIIEINSLTKKYSDFALDNISLNVPRGCIMGLIGENGAGKSTLIKLMLNLIKRDSGEIKIFGMDNRKNNIEIKQKIGVVLDDTNFPETMKLKNISAVMKNIYKEWNEDTFFNYAKRFGLKENITLKQFSKGMKMKTMIAAALSHNPELLILDEATSGLDPIVRDEILDVFLEFIQNENKSILISSHITSDLEKISDYISFIHNGEILFTEPKDELPFRYRIIKCSSEKFEKIDKKAVVGYRKNQFGVEALVISGKTDISSFESVKPSIEDIMLYIVRGERV
ncbi:MAG: ABC transporter ATP-binding protein [Oscillospiraceae bacterium]